MPWAAAVALGAIVAPPDASAAAAVLRQVGLPHRLLVVLEGESLFNDATALLVFRLAVAAAATGSFNPWGALPMLALTCGGGAVLGYAFARLYAATAHRLFDEIGTAVLAQFLATFGVWILAEALHVSAIITVVAYAMTLARIVPARTDARRRIASYAVWEVGVFVLNALAFILIGLQLRGILHRLDGDVRDAALFAGAACLVVVAVRFAYAMSVNALFRWQHRRYGPAAGAGRPLARPTWQGGVVISWCGMRGIVTLAAALALPEGFPFRDLILLTAFSVVLATLVAQGLTLRWLLGRMRLPEDDSVEREVELARAETARAALGALDGAPERLREKYEARLLRPAAGGGDGGRLAAMQGAAVEAQRRRLDALRSDGRIGDTAFHLIEEEIDLLELAADPRLRPGGAA
jgi:CPA1 family monovalent cation:H+ antiporter